MTKAEDNIAFNQWIKDHGHHFPGMKKDTLYYVYRSMDEENKREFLEEAGYVKFSYWCNSCCRRQSKDICEYCKPDETTGIPNGYRSDEEERQINYEMLEESNALNT